MTPARDVSLESYGQTSDAATEVVDADPGLFDSADGDSESDSGASSDAGSDGGSSSD